MDLTDLSSDLVDAFRVCRVNLANLEEKLIREEVVYGADAVKSDETANVFEESK